MHLFAFAALLCSRCEAASRSRRRRLSAAAPRLPPKSWLIRGGFLVPAPPRGRTALALWISTGTKAAKGEARTPVPSMRTSAQGHPRSMTTHAQRKGFPTTSPPYSFPLSSSRTYPLTAALGPVHCFAWISTLGGTFFFVLFFRKHSCKTLNGISADDPGTLDCMASVCHALGRGAVRCRAGAGGVRWGGRGVSASGVGARPCRGPALQGFGRWASGCALLLRVRSAGGAEPLRVAWWGPSTIVEAARGCWRGCRGG